MSKPNSYFFRTILFIVLAILVLLVLKVSLPSRLFPDQASPAQNLVVDSLLLDAMKDTVPDKVPIKDLNQQRAIDSSKQPKIQIDTTWQYRNLNRFFAKLERLKNSKRGRIRIAYYGDSMNDGDFIVQDVRTALQTDFGGVGVGFVGITSLSAKSRGSVLHRFSSDWQTQSFLNVKKPRSPFGIDGQVSFTQSNGTDDDRFWLKFNSTKPPFGSPLYNPRLFYGQSSNSKGMVGITSATGGVANLKLQAKNILNILPVGRSASLHSVALHFHQCDSIPFYGVDFESGAGVYVDNFSIRGNSGLPLSTLNVPLMQAFDRTLGYDLIIMQYGTNVMTQKTTNYSWYEKYMARVIANLRVCFPNADILIISAGDRALKINGALQSDPAAKALTKAQYEYAQKTGAGFISIYNLMGREGSMASYVNQGLAGKDYTHFTIKGSHIIGKKIYDQLMIGYNDYLSHQHQN